MTTSQLEALVKAKFSMPEYATFLNVANGTGANANRFADVVSMSVWPSRGLRLHGMELKVSRSDWQKELGKPDKAESIFGFCDYWWLVIGDEKIVQTGELPEPWGLMIATGKGLKVFKEAPKLDPKPISRVFLAALLRRAKEQEADKEALAAQFEAGRKRGEEDEKRNSNYRLREVERVQKRMQKNLDEFEQASGIRIDGHTLNCKRMGEIVRDLMKDDAIGRMRQFAVESQRVADAVRNAANVLETKPITEEDQLSSTKSLPPSAT